LCSPHIIQNFCFSCTFIPYLPDFHISGISRHFCYRLSGCNRSHFGSSEVPPLDRGSLNSLNFLLSSIRTSISFPKRPIHYLIVYFKYLLSS
jgi:hypothetical protein